MDSIVRCHKAGFSHLNDFISIEKSAIEKNGIISIVTRLVKALNIHKNSTVTITYTIH